MSHSHSHAPAPAPAFGRSRIIRRGTNSTTTGTIAMCHTSAWDVNSYNSRDGRRSASSTPVASGPGPGRNAQPETLRISNRNAFTMDITPSTSTSTSNSNLNSMLKPSQIYNNNCSIDHEHEQCMILLTKLHYGDNTDTDTEIDSVVNDKYTPKRNEEHLLPEQQDSHGSLGKLGRGRRALENSHSGILNMSNAAVMAHRASSTKSSTKSKLGQALAMLVLRKKMIDISPTTTTTTTRTTHNTKPSPTPTPTPAPPPLPTDRH
jgi:hypothetical protein